jgi:hypothetical protein
VYPGFLWALRGCSGPVPGLALRLVESGGIREPLLDAMDEEDVRVLSFAEGDMVYIETLTKYYVGRVIGVTPTELVLGEAAWIEHTGRLAEFLATGQAEGMAIEPYLDPVRIPQHMLTDATKWRHKPFREAV